MSSSTTSCGQSSMVEIRPSGDQESRVLDILMENPLPEVTKIKRWDGAAKKCENWGNWARDPELWFRKGNCLVYLHSRGLSRAGPAFKIPFDALIAAKCHPFVARYIARDPTESPAFQVGQGHLDFAQQVSLSETTELYIPPPPLANKDDVLRFYLATRNLFAWVFRRSLVGQHLGISLIWLLNSMAEFRSPEEDNIDDLMSYLDEEGYLDMRMQPIHAVALLHFAEHYQFSRLYIDAFTHCVGMFDQVLKISEYQMVTSTTRRNIRRAKRELDKRLKHASTKLLNFLEDEISEENTALPTGGRTYIEHFRSFLSEFYRTRLGRYPPAFADQHNHIFDPNIYQVMRNDFEALYEYLVDNSLTAPQSIPAQEGICTLKAVRDFDKRNNFHMLPHPLPLLPAIVQPTAVPPRRISWMSKPNKLKPDQRLLSHAASAKATNSSKRELLKNNLVIAYRKLEEDSVFSPLKVDRQEKLSQVEVRKIHWIMVYCTYQLLRSCTEAPLECQDSDGVKYHIASSTISVPWKDERRLAPRDRRDGRTLAESSSASVLSVMTSPGQPRSTLSQVRSSSGNFGPEYRKANSTPPVILPPRFPPIIPPRIRSLRRSLHIFNHDYDRKPEPLSTAPSRRPYSEIIIQRYGNGLEDKGGYGAWSPESGLVPGDEEDSMSDGSPDEEDLTPEPLAICSIRSPSSSSAFSVNSSAACSTMSRFSEPSTAPTAATSFASRPTSICKSPGDDTTFIRLSEEYPAITQTLVIPKRRASIRSKKQVSNQMSASAPQSSPPNIAAEPLPVTRDDELVPPPLPRKNSRRKMSRLHPQPLRIRKISPPSPTPSCQ
ncbi:hypothetical protein B0T17DRAFT_507482 [Bombardia bombarda]|uniref:DUF8004 domain-containing protein n=1 Tax=Bombardia bombarda TaxID=252184 RepID=A0AA39XC86_9PEZI|nr:hypothetical protein B0T17DRAFT_507482 [Bombardia bombarda]